MSLGEIIAREETAAEICRKRAEAAKTEEIKHDLAWAAAEHSEIVRCMKELQRYRRTRLTPEMQLTVDCATQHIREFLEQSTKGEVADLGKVCGSNCEVWRAGRCINFDWIKNLDPIMSKSGVKVSLDKAGKNGETGITADKNFARGIANFTEKHLKNNMIRIAEENWTDSQVKMLKGLICAAINGIEYADAYEAANRD